MKTKITNRTMKDNFNYIAGLIKQNTSIRDYNPNINIYPHGRSTKSSKKENIEYGFASFSYKDYSFTIYITESLDDDRIEVSTTLLAKYNTISLSSNICERIIERILKLIELQKIEIDKKHAVREAEYQKTEDHKQRAIKLKNILNFDVKSLYLGIGGYKDRFCIRFSANYGMLFQQTLDQYDQKPRYKIHKITGDISEEELKQIVNIIGSNPNVIFEKLNGDI